MEREPTEAYVYQPDRHNGIDVDARIFAVAGPGTEKYAGRRYTRATADMLARSVNAKLEEARRPHDFDYQSRHCRQCGLSEKEVMLSRLVVCRPQDHALAGLLKAVHDGEGKR